jgi:hypothetical protein
MIQFKTLLHLFFMCFTITSFVIPSLLIPYGNTSFIHSALEGPQNVGDRRDAERAAQPWGSSLAAAGGNAEHVGDAPEASCQVAARSEECVTRSIPADLADASVLVAV